MISGELSAMCALLHSRFGRPYIPFGSRPRPASSHYPTQTKLPGLWATPSLQFPGRMAEGVKPEANRIQSVSELKLKLNLAPQNREIAKTARKSGPWSSPGAQRDLSRESPLSDSLLSFPSELLFAHTDPSQHQVCRSDGGTRVESLCQGLLVWRDASTRNRE